MVMTTEEIHAATIDDLERRLFDAKRKRFIADREIEYLKDYIIAKKRAEQTNVEQPEDIRGSA